MNNRQYLYGIVPPHVLEAIAKNGTRAQRAAAKRALAADVAIRADRVAQMRAMAAAPAFAMAPDVGAPHKNRRVYSAGNTTNLPGTLVRSEGQGPSGDVAVDEAYDGLGATFDLFCDIYSRNSIDDRGMDLIGIVHYDKYYDNAFFDGEEMVFGDGDGQYFNRFTIDIDVMGHELSHGVTATTANLEYHDQPGALNESISDVFGSLVKQRALGQAADQADWLIGAHLFTAQVNATALRSMKAPGTAYDDPVIGRDPQPDHMSRYVQGGDVHVNSGIPNKAFYLAAMALGGYAWEKAGSIWYQTLLDSRLSAVAQLIDFAKLTAEHAGTLYGDPAQAAVVEAWHEVGIEVGGQPPSGWELLDTNPASVAIAADGNNLYQLHDSHRIWKYVGPPISGWESLDANPATVKICAAGGVLYQIQHTGLIYKYADPATGWQLLDANPASVDIAADGNDLYQLHRTGLIWKYLGTPLTGWQMLDNNPVACKIAASGGNLYQLHRTGKIWKYVGPQGTTWKLMDSSASALDIAADGDDLYQLRGNGQIWKYLGQPKLKWQMLDNNTKAVQIVATGGNLYQLHNTGTIWKYAGQPNAAWVQVDNNPLTTAIAGAGGQLYQIRADGCILRYTG